MSTPKPQLTTQTTPQGAIAKQNQALRRYYKLHSGIYDASRWSFLFGRKAIVERLAITASPKQILEVGCGTGKNLTLLAEVFKDAHITGVDVSADMLAVAKRKTARFGDRLSLAEQAYPQPHPNGRKYDLILFAYALSMFNPGWETAITSAVNDLNEGGTLAVVDFHRTTFSSFQRWMAVNHVRMEGHLLPFLQNHTNSSSHTIHRAYAGLWEYVLFTGSKSGPQSSSLKTAQ